jgi:hypothetical protein
MRDMGPYLETYVILSADAIEEPPNFITILFTPFEGGSISMSSPMLSRSDFEMEINFSCSGVRVVRLSDSVEAPFSGANLILSIRLI